MKTKLFLVLTCALLLLAACAAPAPMVTTDGGKTIAQLGPAKFVVPPGFRILNTMKDVDYHGIGAIADAAIDKISNGTAGFAVSFDLDVCDPKLVPGTGTPSRGGLTFREAHLLLELIAESGKMLSFELTELNPILDREFQTADVAISFIESVCGKTIL